MLEVIDELRDKVARWRGLESTCVSGALFDSIHARIEAHRGGSPPPPPLPMTAVGSAMVSSAAPVSQADGSHGVKRGGVPPWPKLGTRPILWTMPASMRGVQSHAAGCAAWGSGRLPTRAHACTLVRVSYGEHRWEIRLRSDPIPGAAWHDATADWACSQQPGRWGSSTRERHRSHSVVRRYATCFEATDC